jgi:hypothetical protein
VGKSPFTQRPGYICRNPSGQLGSGRWRAYIVTWGVGAGSGDGIVVSLKLLCTESSMRSNPEVGRRVKANLSEGTEVKTCGLAP